MVLSSVWMGLSAPGHRTDWIQECVSPAGRDSVLPEESEGP